MRGWLTPGRPEAGIHSPRSRLVAYPEGSLTSFIAEGKPSSSVRRLPLESTMEIRPEFRSVVPVSETSRLPSFVKTVPSGSKRPEMSSVHCAFAEAVPSRSAETANATERMIGTRIFFVIQGTNGMPETGSGKIWKSVARQFDCRRVFPVAAPD